MLRCLLTVQVKLVLQSISDNNFEANLNTATIIIQALIFLHKVESERNSCEKTYFYVEHSCPIWVLLQLNPWKGFHRLPTSSKKHSKNGMW